MADGNGLISSLQAGLSTSSTRGRILASNLANVETPGYRRMAVKFREDLSDALQRGEVTDPSKLGIQVFRPLTTSVEANGNDVNVDHEVGEMIINSAKYKTYMRMLTKAYRQMDMAIRTD